MSFARFVIQYYVASVLVVRWRASAIISCTGADDHVETPDQPEFFKLGQFQSSPQVTVSAKHTQMRNDSVVSVCHEIATCVRLREEMTLGMFVQARYLILVSRNLGIQWFF